MSEQLTGSTRRQAILNNIQNNLNTHRVDLMVSPPKWQNERTQLNENNLNAVSTSITQLQTNFVGENIVSQGILYQLTENIAGWKVSGEGTLSTAEIFNDYENNSAIAEHSHAQGKNTSVGMEGKREKLDDDGNVELDENSNPILEDYIFGVGASAEGVGTIATADAQHVQGMWNVKDEDRKYSHIIGAGQSDTNRKNIHTVDWSGNAWYAGNLSIDGDTELNKSLTVKNMTTLKSCLHVTGNTYLCKNDSSTLTVSGESTFTKKVTFNELGTFDKGINVIGTVANTGNTTVSGTLSVGGLTTLGSLNVTNDTILSSNLTINGISTFNSDVTVNGVVTCNDSIEVSNSVTSTSMNTEALTVSGESTLNKVEANNIVSSTTITADEEITSKKDVKISNDGVDISLLDTHNALNSEISTRANEDSRILKEAKEYASNEIATVIKAYITDEENPDNPDAIDKLVEISNWIVDEDAGAAKIISNVESNKEKIDVIMGTGEGSISKAISDLDLPNTYADISHNHDDNYSDINHNHDEHYAPLVHSHSEYLTEDNLEQRIDEAVADLGLEVEAVNTAADIITNQIGEINGWDSSDGTSLTMVSELLSDLNSRVIELNNRIIALEGMIASGTDSPDSYEGDATYYIQYEE